MVLRKQIIDERILLEKEFDKEEEKSNLQIQKQVLHYPFVFVSHGDKMKHATKII